ncbi:SAM-dependent methyltransferase [Kocuria carniphila]|uniref:SAM-dependent methyltransferase n=1 Tax=Kocuria carniphila TaxID=262208 RepID=UPI0034CF15CE
MAYPPVLDPACGSRMMWFDKNDQRALFGDIRSEQYVLCDGRALSITPDELMDFRDLPFDDNTFRLVVFDPPHIRRASPKGWQGKKYGILGNDWLQDLTAGFTECFRVLKPGGVLIFKWSEVQIPLRQILGLTPHKPLFGHRTGKQAGTHWITFIKTEETRDQ